MFRICGIIDCLFICRACCVLILQGQQVLNNHRMTCFSSQSMSLDLATDNITAENEKYMYLERENSPHRRGFDMLTYDKISDLWYTFTGWKLIWSHNGLEKMASSLFIFFPPSTHSRAVMAWRSTYLRQFIHFSLVTIQLRITESHLLYFLVS